MFPRIGASIVTAGEVAAARSSTEPGRRQSLATINSVIRGYGKSLHTAQAPRRPSLAQHQLLSKLSVPGGTQSQSAVTDSTHKALKSAIPQQIQVAPTVPVMQQGGACDAYAGKVLKEYEEQTATGVPEPKQPASLIEKIQVMLNGRQETSGDLLKSGQQLRDTYFATGPFTIHGPGLANAGYAVHSMPVMAVVAADVDGVDKTVLIVLDRNDEARDDAALAVHELANELGTHPSVMPQSVLNRHPELTDEYDKSCIRLIDADAAVKHANAMHQHYEARGMDLPRPGIEYLKRGLKPITPEQEAALKPAIASAYRNGEVETYKDVDYSILAHNKKKSM